MLAWWHLSAAKVRRVSFRDNITWRGSVQGVLVDAGLFSAINGLAGRADSVDDFFELFSRVAPFVLVGLALLAWFWPGARAERDRRQWGALVAGGGAALALGINQVIIHLWERPRPFMSHSATLLLAPSHDPSFPSDHAAFAFAVAVGICFAWRRVGMLALLLAALLSFARVYTGEHYVGDVVAGGLIGAGVALALNQARPWLLPVLDPPLRLARRLRLG
jgi:undecaprenyl-diphosphatase